MVDYDGAAGCSRSLESARTSFVPEGGFDRGDAVGADAQRVVDTHLGVEMPQHAVLIRLGDQRPGDHRASQLLVHGIADGRGALRRSALGVMVQKLP